MPRKFAHWSSLAFGLFASATCLADAPSTPQLADNSAAALPTIYRADMVNDGRPEGFYSLKFGADSKVCQTLDGAMRRKHKVDARRSQDSNRDLLLGSEYSIKWVDLKDHLNLPVSRADIDLNNDGQAETVYRLASMLGGPYLYELAITDGYPAGESVLTKERKSEILGAPLDDPKWGGVQRNVVLIMPPRYIAGTSDTVSRFRHLIIHVVQAISSPVRCLKREVTRVISRLN